MSKNTSFVHNESSRSERRAVLENDRRVREGTTYHQIAAAESDLVGGRFAAREKSTVIASSGPVEYPRLPESSPWSAVVESIEPPFPADISLVEPCGTAAEVEQSLQALVEAQGEGVKAPQSPGATASGDAQRDCTVSSYAPRAVTRRRRTHSKGRDDASG